MTRTITVGSADIVDYYRKNKFRLSQESEDIAENEAIGVVIYLSDTNGRPTITVLADDMQVAEATTGVDGLSELTQTMYDTYLDEQAFISAMTEGETDDEYNEEELAEALINEREDELDVAVDDFLATVLQTNGYEYDSAIDEIHDDVKEHFLEYLARKFKIELYRPMYLEDENGEDFFEEYPYGCMEFEDEANPIYM